MAVHTPKLTDRPSAARASIGGPKLKSVRAADSWQGSMRTEVRVRNFTFCSDEPEPVGGTNSAPTPMEFVTGAVNACVTVVIETVANELGVSLGAISTNAAAHVDIRGFEGTADVSPHFQDFTLTISIVSDAAPAMLEQLRVKVERRCPALNLVRDAGVPVQLVWDFSGAAVVAEQTRPRTKGSER